VEGLLGGGGGCATRIGKDRSPACPPSLLPPHPPFLPPPLLVYISPKDVIELNKAFLGGSCHSCCLWHVKRHRHFKSTYICSKLAGQIGGRGDDGAAAASATRGPRSCEQFTGMSGAPSGPLIMKGSGARAHTHTHTHTDV